MGGDEEEGDDIMAWREIFEGTERIDICVIPNCICI